MTKHERYQKAESLLRHVVEILFDILESEGEKSITCYFAKALDEPIQEMIEAKMHMAVAENMESIQNEFRKTTDKLNTEQLRKLRDSVKEDVKHSKKLQLGVGMKEVEL